MKTEEKQHLNLRWRKITGQDMPSDIARLEIDLIRRAVEHKAAGEEVFLPKEPVSRPDDRVGGELIWWDSVE